MLTFNHSFNTRANGVRFVAPAGTTEFAKRWNPQPGDIVSFKHRGFMLVSNKPKMPTIFRIRDDITWDDVVRNWNEQDPSLKTRSPTGISSIPKMVFLPYQITARPIKTNKHNPVGYWSNVTNQREFLLAFAQNMGFDPMVIENWRSQTLNIKAHGVTTYHIFL